MDINKIIEDEIGLLETFRNETKWIDRGKKGIIGEGVSKKDMDKRVADAQKRLGEKDMLDLAKKYGLGGIKVAGGK